MSKSQQIHGRFTIKLVPQPLSEPGQSAGLNRMSLDKQYEGELLASSTGEMLAFRSQTQGSAGYIALETVVGRLHGRQGSFVLQHSATMERGRPKQSITVVPDSGTGELLGLAGEMEISVDGDQHSYRFDYRLPKD